MLGLSYRLAEDMLTLLCGDTADLFGLKLDLDYVACDGVLLEALSLLNGDVLIGVGDLAHDVLTHEHADHVCGLLRASQEGLKVYAHARTTLAINAKCGRIQTENLPFYDGGFAIGDITVLPFRVPHDAVYPLAYSFIEGGDKISVATDIGHPTEGIINNLKNSRILLLEANHDREMLLSLIHI